MCTCGLELSSLPHYYIVLRSHGSTEDAYIHLTGSRARNTMCTQPCFGRNNAELVARSRWQNRAIDKTLLHTALSSLVWITAEGQLKR